MSQMHEPWKSRQSISIKGVLRENLMLRQKLNKVEKHYLRKLLRAEKTREYAERDLRNLKEDFDILLEDFVRLKLKHEELKQSLSDKTI